MSLGLSFVCCALVFLSAQQDVGFTGVWERNVEQSDDAQEMMQQAISQMREQGGGGGGRRGGGGRPPGGGGGKGSSGGGRDGGPGGGGARPDLGSVADEMSVELVEGELQVDDGKRLRIYYLDDEKHKKKMPNGTKLETVAELKGNAVFIEEKMDRGQIDRKFELSPEGGTMIMTVTVKLGNMQDPVVIKTVYERVPESTS